MTYTIAVIVNKDSGSLGASETFLHAHIKQLPCSTVSLVGNPGYRCLDEARGIYAPPRSLVQLSLRWMLRRAGVTTVALQDRKAVARFLKSRKIDAVLAEYGQTAVSVMDACRDVSVPLIAHFHGWDAYSHSLSEKRGDEYRRLFRQSAAIIAVSQHMRARLLSMGADPDKTFHNSCGAEVPHDIKASPEQSGKHFLMVGRLTEKKAPFVSIMAFAKVAASHPDARLDIIGDGPLTDACLQISKSLGLGEQVVFYGERPHTVVMELMAKARCFIQHSVRAPSGDHEGTPVGVLEAMGMGLPVVSTRHGGIMDVVKEGESGILVDEYDMEAMAGAMMLYAENARQAQRDGEVGRDEVLKNLTGEKSIERLWSIIEKTIHNSK